MTTLSGCLVPLPLEQENPSDGGQLLVVTGATPAFGAQRAINAMDRFVYSVDADSDSDTVSGRLFVQLNSSCCELSNDPKVTRFLLNATGVSLGNQHQTIKFGTVQPCLQVAPNPTAYIVPVLTTGGFVDGPDGTRPEAMGTIDQTHYWSVNCP